VIEKEVKDVSRHDDKYKHCHVATRTICQEVDGSIGDKALSHSDEDHLPGGLWVYRR
jgi:hypothetical protein